jgi:hypothetical protein
MCFSPQMKDVLLDKYKAITRVVIKDIVVEKKGTETQLDSAIFYLNDKATKRCDEKTAQAKDDLMLKFSCFKSGDVAAVKDILHYPTFSIINFNPKVDVKIVSYTFVVPKMDIRRNPKGIEGIENTGIELNAESFEMAKRLLPDEEFVISNIKVEFSNRKNENKGDRNCSANYNKNWKEKARKIVGKQALILFLYLNIPVNC